jgi:hypothetical protein
MIPVTHQEIADEIGSPREAVSRVLKKLEHDGALKLIPRQNQTDAGRVTIINAVCNKCNQKGLSIRPTFVSSNQQRQNDMKVEQIYTGCLAHGAYYIESNGEVAIVDPTARSKLPTSERARKDGAKVRYILETHFHADFVSGHLDLAKKTGCHDRLRPHGSSQF